MVMLGVKPKLGWVSTGHMNKLKDLPKISWGLRKLRRLLAMAMWA